MRNAHDQNKIFALYEKITLFWVLTFLFKKAQASYKKAA